MMLMIICVALRMMMLMMMTLAGDPALARHPAHLPGFLLARHGQLGHQPHHLLPDERQVEHLTGAYMRSQQCLIDIL